MTTDIDLDSIESAARAATPGPWRLSDGRPVRVLDADNCYVCTGHTPAGDRDLAHIATAHPGAVLAMVARIRELEGAVDTAIDLLDEAGIDNERSQSLTAARWLTKPEVAAVFRALLPAEDFTRNAEWLRKNRDAYEGKWIALFDGELVDQDSSRLALHKRLMAAGRLCRGTLFTKVD